MASNKIVDTFNEWQKKNPNNVPFQGNNLIANNVHVQNHLINQYRNTNNAPISSKEKNIDIIKKMLEPEKPNKVNEKNNMDAVKTNFEARKTQQIQAKKKIDIQMTNQPYKCILNDSLVFKKKVEDVKKADLIDHFINKKIEANPKEFAVKCNTKEKERVVHNDELTIEFSIDNYDKNKKKFEFKENFIRNMAYDGKDTDETKKDCIEFYKNKLKEAEEGKNICDETLHLLANRGMIDTDELPSN
jgi:hypothetical protein